MASSSDTITLTHPEDWEPWLWQLRGVTDKKIWPHIDPDEPAPERDSDLVGLDPYWSSGWSEAGIGGGSIDFIRGLEWI